MISTQKLGSVQHQVSPRVVLGRAKQKVIMDWVVRLSLILLILIMICPILWLLLTSLKSDTELFTRPVVWIPKRLMWSNYINLLTHSEFPMYFRNSMIIAVGSTVGTLMASTLVAYGFGKISWRGREAVFLVMLVTMMIPFQVLMIPLFTVFKHLGWIGTIAPLVVPWWFGDALSIFIIRQFLMGIPNEISEAARIDGCNEFGIFTLVILPQLKSVLWVVVIFAFMASWNDFLGPLIYLVDNSQFTLSLGLYSFLSSHVKEWQTMFAYAVLMSIPPVVLYALGQKYFIKGLAITSLK